MSRQLYYSHPLHSPITIFSTTTAGSTIHIYKLIVSVQSLIHKSSQTYLQLVCTRWRRKVGHHSHNVRRRESIHPVPCSRHRPRCSIRDKVLCLRHLIVHLDCEREWPIVPIRIQRRRDIRRNRDIPCLPDRVEIIKRVCPVRMTRVSPSCK
jgi:hypothetical protein